MAEPTPETYRDPAAFHRMLAEQSAPQAEERPAVPAAEEAPEEEAAEESAAEERADDAPEGESPAEEEAAPESDEEPEALKPGEKPVPPARLKKEADKRRAAEEQAASAKAEAAAARKQLEDMNALLARQLEDLKKPAEAKAEPLPSDDELDKLDALDPETTGALVKTIKALKRELAEAKEEIKGAKSESAQTRTLTAVDRQTEQFRKETPDYDAAFNHLARAEYDKALAMFGDENTARDAAKAAVGTIVTVAVKQNKNPADVIYKMAHAYGYRKAEPAKEAPKRREPDQAKLAENRKKTESVGSVPAAAPNPLGIYATKDGFDKLRSAPGKKIDPAKFHNMLKKAREGGQYVA